MARFDVFMIGGTQFIPLEVDAEDIQTLTEQLTRQRFLIGRFSAEAEDRALKSISIPISRIDLLCEAE